MSDQSAAGPYTRGLRRFHLVLVILIIALAATGFSIYFRKPLGLQPHKLTLVYLHATIAYAFLALIGWRLWRGFRGPEPDRFRHVLPRRADLARLVRERRFKFAGRSPLSRTLAGALYLLFAANAATGVVRAGTDIYYWPFGPLVQAYVAKPGANPSDLTPRDKSAADERKLERISRAKIPFGKAHIYGAFLIAALAAAHAVGVMSTEWRAPFATGRRGRARLMLFGPRAR